MGLPRLRMRTSCFVSPSRLICLGGGAHGTHARRLNRGEMTQRTEHAPEQSMSMCVQSRENEWFVVNTIIHGYMRMRASKHAGHWRSTKIDVSRKSQRTRDVKAPAIEIVSEHIAL